MAHRNSHKSIHITLIKYMPFCFIKYSLYKKVNQTLWILMRCIFCDTILHDQSCVKKLMNFNLCFMHNWIWMWIKGTQNENCLANFNVKFPSIKVNWNLSTVLVMNMYKRYKLQLCNHFMYSMVTKLNMYNYHPHSQYNCANVFVKLTSITILTNEYHHTVYLYHCTMHFEDSLSIAHQQMHWLCVIYWFKIIITKTLSLLLHVSIAHHISSGSTCSS
jgi:hypothetical protein